MLWFEQSKSNFVVEELEENKAEQPVSLSTEDVNQESEDNQQSEIIEVSVMFVSGKSELYKISSQDDLQTLKEMAASKMAYKLENTVLIMNGRKLNGNKKISEYGINSSTKLFWTPMVLSNLYWANLE